MSLIGNQSERQFAVAVVQLRESRAAALVSAVRGGGSGCGICRSLTAIGRGTVTGIVTLGVTEINVLGNYLGAAALVSVSVLPPKHCGNIWISGSRVAPQMQKFHTIFCKIFAFFLSYFFLIAFFKEIKTF